MPKAIELICPRPTARARGYGQSSRAHFRAVIQEPSSRKDRRVRERGRSLNPSISESKIRYLHTKSHKRHIKYLTVTKRARTFWRLGSPRSRPRGIPRQVRSFPRIAG